MAGIDDTAWDPTRRRLLQGLLSAQGNDQSQASSPPQPSPDASGVNVGGQATAPTTDVQQPPSDDGGDTGAAVRRYVTPGTASDGTSPDDPNEIEITPEDVQQAEDKARMADIDARMRRLQPIAERGNGGNPNTVAATADMWKRQDNRRLAAQMDSQFSQQLDADDLKGLDSAPTKAQLADARRRRREWIESRLNASDAWRQAHSAEMDRAKVNTGANEIELKSGMTPDDPELSPYEGGSRRDVFSNDSSQDPGYIGLPGSEPKLQLSNWLKYPLGEPTPGNRNASLPPNGPVPVSDELTGNTSDLSDAEDPSGLAKLRQIQTGTFPGAQTSSQTQAPDAISGGRTTDQLVPKVQVQQAVHAAAMQAGAAATVNALSPERLNDAIGSRAQQLLGQSDARSSQVQLDPNDGQQAATSTSDMLYQASQRLDEGYQATRKALALEQATAEERARQGLPLQQQLQTTVDKYDDLRRKYFDDAVAARQRALQAYPNPDRLLGGKGSWSRAFALALASSGIPGDAQLVNASLQLQMDSQQARFERERFAEQNAVSNTEAATYMVSAARDRLSEQLRTVAAQTSLPAIQAQYMRMAGELDQKNAEELGKLATVKANSDLKDAQMASAGWHFYKGQWFPPPGQGGRAVGGAGGGSTSSNEGFGFDRLPKEQRERAVTIQDDRPPLILPDKGVADSVRPMITAARETSKIASEVISELDQFNGTDLRDLYKYTRTREGERLLTNIRYMTANEAAQFKGRSKAMLDYLAGDNEDPGKSVFDKEAMKSSLKTVIGLSQSKIYDTLSPLGYSRDYLRKIGQDPTLPQAPPVARPKDIDENLGGVGTPPVLNKDGTVDYPTRDVLVRSLDAAVEAGLRDKLPPREIINKLDAADSRLNQVRAKASLQLAKEMTKPGSKPSDPLRNSLARVANDSSFAMAHIQKQREELESGIKSDQQMRDENRDRQIRIMQNTLK